jgi:hypothetical protein
MDALYSACEGGEPCLVKALLLVVQPQHHHQYQQHQHNRHIRTNARTTSTGTNTGIFGTGTGTGTTACGLAAGPALTLWANGRCSKDRPALTPLHATALAVSVPVRTSQTGSQDCLCNRNSGHLGVLRLLVNHGAHVNLVIWYTRSVYVCAVD